MRLLTYTGARGAPSLAAHRELAGAVIAHRGAALIEAVAAAGLRGRGGAAFPTAVKMRAVASRRGRRALVVNGAEGEPMSAKDRVLLEYAPHLVLDGVVLVAEAIGARDVVVAVKRSAWPSGEAVLQALAERGDDRGVRLEWVPDGYLSGEESALLQALNGGPAKPTLVPPRPYERGLARRPTLVANVETLAHVALIARHGADWFREVGTHEHPGSALVTVGGAVARPGVYEVALGTPVADLIPGEWRAALVGGYYGSWLSAAEARAARFDNASLRGYGGSVGAGVVVALPVEACPAAEVARVVRWMADENAGQCGPCVHGLEAIAGTVTAMAMGTAGRDGVARLERWTGQVEGRGACHHPNGVARFVRSALTVFAEELDDHRRHGPCSACSRSPVLAVPITAVRRAA